MEATIFTFNITEAGNPAGSSSSRARIVPPLSSTTVSVVHFFLKIRKIHVHIVDFIVFRRQWIRRLLMNK